MKKKRLAAIGIKKKGEKGFTVKTEEKEEKPKVKRVLNFMGEKYEFKT